MVAYNGYTGAAKINTAKANQKNVLKWIAAEAQKCQLGIDDIFNGLTTCYNINGTMQAGGNPSVHAINRIETALKGKFKNPYGAINPNWGDEGVKATRDRGSGSTNNVEDLGYVLLKVKVDYNVPYYFRINVSVCYKLPCSGDSWNNSNPNVIVDIYTWYP